jgi:hypothetical protein
VAMNADTHGSQKMLPMKSFDFETFHLSGPGLNVDQIALDNLGLSGHRI